MLGRYYSSAIIDCLQRNIAIPEWMKLREDENAVPLQRALGCFDLFVPQCGIDSLDEVFFLRSFKGLLVL